jgi:hypothetical protein
MCRCLQICREPNKLSAYVKLRTSYGEAPCGDIHLFVLPLSPSFDFINLLRPLEAGSVTLVEYQAGIIEWLDNVSI